MKTINDLCEVTCTGKLEQAINLLRRRVERSGHLKDLKARERNPTKAGRRRAKVRLAEMRLKKKRRRSAR